jgi:hypothetical protein
VGDGDGRFLVLPTVAPDSGRRGARDGMKQPSGGDPLGAIVLVVYTVAVTLALVWSMHRLVHPPHAAKGLASIEDSR